MEKDAYLETIRQAGFDAVEAVSQKPYEAPGLDERLQGKILSLQVRGVKGPDNS